MHGRDGFLGRLFGRAPAPAGRVEPVLTAAPVVERPTRVPNVRAYKAAKAGRLAGGFGIWPSSPRAELRQDLRGLIQHARHGAQNIDYLRSYEMMVRRHVVGPRGIVLQMGALDFSGAKDTVGNRKIESAWAEWGRRGNCTTCGRMTWRQVEAVAATMVAREGNFLLRLWRGRGFGPHGFQVQPVSVDLLDLSAVMTLGGGRYIDGGVEFDELGRVLAYHLFRGHPAETHTGSRTDRVRVPAEEIVHVWRPVETGQALGVPASHTALRRFNLLGQYEEAALAAAHNGAASMGFLSPPATDMPTPGGDGGAMAIPEEVEPGSIAELPPGWTYQEHRPNYPDGEMPAFNKAMIRGGAAGLGVSYAGLSSDMEGASFSSLKDGRGEERDEWRMFQRDLAEGLHGPVFREWLPHALISGRVGLPFSRLEKFVDAASWRGRGWASANPRDDAAVVESDLGNGLRAPSDIVAERGEDFEETVERLAADLALLNSAGLPLPAALRPKASAPAPAEGGASARPSDGAPDEGAPEDGAAADPDR